MNFVKPIYTHRMVYIPGVYNKLEEVQDRAKLHANKLVNEVKNLLNSPENRLNKFIQEWFAKFDVLPTSSDFFTRSLSSDIRLVMPDGEFIGHEGFRDWYEIARATFKPNCEHIVEQLSIETTEDNKFVVNLRVRLKAETYPTSGLQGQNINMLVNETWRIIFNEQDQIIIEEYLVDVVNN